MSQPTPTVLSTPTAQVTFTASPSPIAISWQAIDQRFTTPLLAVATTDTEVLWSAGPEADGNFAPDLYRLDVDSAAVERLVRSPDRQANLLPIAGSSAGYAYVRSVYDGNLAIWQLWYVPAGGATEPVLLDEMDPPPEGIAPAPTLALSDSWLVWAAVHVRDGVPTSELTALALGSTASTVLESAPAGDAQYWFPSLDGAGLVYNVLRQRPTDSSREVYLRDLSTQAPPERLDDTGSAAIPQISGDTVIWKESIDNLLNWGRLVRYSLTSRETTPIVFGDETSLNYPTIGSRFVAAWERSSSTFYVYDLLEQRSVVVEALEPASLDVNVRPYVHGRVLAWSHAPAEGDLELRWTLLPD